MNEASRPLFGGPDSDGVSFELFPQHPRAAAAALSPRESVSRNFQSPMAPYKFRSLATPERGARVRIENSCCPLRGYRVYGVKRRE